MTLGEVYNFLNGVSPFELQESWDNSGLQIGEKSQRISQIVLSLDVTDELVQTYDEGTLFVVHHPLIFGKLTQLDLSKYPANIIATMIRKNQSLIAMHTNVDKTHLNHFVFTQVLGFECESEEDFMLHSNEKIDKEKLYNLLKTKLGLKNFKVVNEKEQIKGIALTTGSGSSMMDLCRGECFLTGDIKYHEAMKAQSQNLMLVDIGHFESEQFFAHALEADLKKLDISVIIANSKNPFKNVTI